MRASFLLVLLLVAGCPSPPSPQPPPKPTATPKVEPKAPAGVQKSSLDQRTYRAFKLANGIQVLVASDPDTDLAAAALNVHVGHYADPQDRQGLAHFLEHMLFMGTKAFPDVDGYRKFIQDHGGGTNAWTSAEHTTYYFDIQHDSLAPALDRFSAFFVSPLLDPKQVERERNAVNAEYRMKIKDAWRRGRQVRKEATNPNHPESKFSVGNLDTLADRDGKPVYEALRKLYDEHYGPERMTVAVIGREDVDTLATWVTERFSAVPGNPKPVAARPKPFLPEQLGVRIDIQPLRDTKELEVQWVVPPRQQMWPKRPHAYITHVLGHEGQGSLFAYLKGKGYIESLVASHPDAADDHDLLSIEVALTDDGFAHVDDVLDGIFQYVRMMRTTAPKTYIHDEAKRISELSFRFQEESSPSSLVTGATQALHQYPPHHVLNWWATWAPFDAAAVSGVLSNLTVENARVIVTAKGTKTKSVEPLYDVPWGMRGLTVAERKRWSEGEIASSMSLPAPNPWLPKATALKAKGAAAQPAKVASEPTLEIWHGLDTEFGAPRGLVLLRIVTGTRNDLRTNVLGSLHARLVEDAVELWGYPVEVAGLGFSWRAVTGGMELRVTGYDDRQPEVLDALLERMVALKVDPARFALERAELARDWKNQRLDRPYSQAARAMAISLNPESWSRPDAVATLEALTPDDMRAWRKAMLSKAWAQLFVHGNHTKADALKMGELVKQRLLSKAKPAKPGDNRTRLVPDRPLTLALDIAHDDSTLVVTYQSRVADLATEARYRFLASLMKTSFFGELRTKQQLGYIVSAHYYNWDVLPGLRMLIQSSTSGPDVLLERVDAFITSHKKTIGDMSDSEFATIRQGLIAQLLEAETQLYRRSNRHVGNLRLRRAWDHHAQLAKVIGTLDRATMVAFYKRVLNDKAGRFVVRSVGRAHKAKGQPPADCRTITCVAKKLRAEHTRPF